MFHLSHELFLNQSPLAFMLSFSVEEEGYHSVSIPSTFPVSD
jgi:hypothetical protein